MSRMPQSTYYVRNKCACLNVSSKDRSWSFRCEILTFIPLHSERPSGAVRASSLFPILSVGLLFLGGVCVAASEFYKSRYNVILSAGILFVSAGQKLTHTYPSIASASTVFRMDLTISFPPAGLSNIIGIIVYISANSGDPSQSDNKKSYSYGWSFYFGALSFVLAEMVGVLAVHVFIEKHRQLRTKGRPSLMKPPMSRNSSYYRNRYYHNRGRRYSYRSNHSGADSTSNSFRASLVRDREPSISAESKVMEALPAPVSVGSEFMLYTLASPFKDSKIDLAVEDLTTAAAHNNTEILPANCAANRKTTPVWKAATWGTFDFLSVIELRLWWPQQDRID